VPVQVEKKEQTRAARSPAIKREAGEIFDLTGVDYAPRPMKISKREDGKDVIDLTDD